MRLARQMMALAAATMLAPAGCGIPTDTRPEALPGGVVSPALGSPATTATGSVAGRVLVFLVRADRLVAVPRAPSTPDPDLQPMLAVLLDGPTEAELAAGIRSAIAPQTRLRSTRVKGTTATLDLTSDFVEVGGQEQILAVAQFVLTATAVPGISQVRFALDGQDVEVPRADGTLALGPLTAADYDSLRATDG